MSAATSLLMREQPETMTFCYACGGYQLQRSGRWSDCLCDVREPRPMTLDAAAHDAFLTALDGLLGGQSPVAVPEAAAKLAMALGSAAFEAVELWEAAAA
ncbi:MAG: hypothetical protein QOJ92_875 [Frankiales bacterium]|nr:hypothetical protein [Frankiales bacterium]